ncbi:MAG: DNA recombination protein RmuC, partial [Gammaproteobacteria bacterium]|nr:DNA recombination protein RmuC [Gammaproteobacteria bacterium]
MLQFLTIIFAFCIILILIAWLWLWLKKSLNQSKLELLLTRLEERDRMNNEMRESIMRLLLDQGEKFNQLQLQTLKTLVESLQSGMADIRVQITSALVNNADELGKRVDKLTYATDARLKEISGQVEKRLADGFEKTTATFADVLKRLALIDEAQKKITDLSHNVISLQEILNDKRSRGAFGEVQLAGLIRNVLPESHFSLQHTLSNGKRTDCMLFLPDPTGNVAIDAKFPLENYRKLAETDLTADERHAAEQQFKQDIKKHIYDISEKYIIPGETSDSALMFIPAEAVFAKIHAEYPDLIELSHKQKVWMVSPTTMMAILTTARAVIKDAATRQQVHIIQEHLIGLSKDFDRFQSRMDNLAKHIDQAHIDIDEVHKSSKKISSRFQKIESVDCYV